MGVLQQNMIRLFMYPLKLYVGYPTTVVQVQNPEEFKTLEKMFLDNMLDFQSSLSPRFSTFDCEDPFRSETAPCLPSVC